MASQKTFKINQHSYNVLLKLNEMRDEKSFCDVCIEVENKIFPVHRNVLSAASDYFNKMFSIHMKEKDQQTIEIKEISHETMEAVLNFIYIGEITLTESNISSILNAASLMQISDLLKVVDEYLSEILDVSNCLELRKLAAMHSLDALVIQANQFILNEFEEVSSQELFYDLDTEEIQFLLKSDELVIKDEKEVYETVITWVNFDLENRKQHFSDLFKCVRLQFVPVRYVALNIRKDKLVREFPDCRDLVEDAAFFHILPEIMTAETPRSSYKPKMDSIMVVDPSSSYQNLFNVENKTWTQATNTGWKQNLVLTDCAVAFKLNSYVFCGGRTRGNQTSKAVIQFNGKDWKHLEVMTANRCGGAATYHNNTLYVFGGEISWIDPNLQYNSRSNRINEREFVQTFELFDGNWFTLGNTKTVRSYARAECFANKIYLFGGYTSNTTTRGQFDFRVEFYKVPCSSTDVYDIHNETWSDGPKLNVARADFASATLDATIYALGGTGVNCSNLLSVEFMKTETEVNVWTRLNTNSPYSLRSPSACSFNGQIFVNSPDNNIIICFNPASHLWSPGDPEGFTVYGGLIIPISMK